MKLVTLVLEVNDGVFDEDLLEAVTKSCHGEGINEREDFALSNVLDVSMPNNPVSEALAQYLVDMIKNNAEEEMYNEDAESFQEYCNQRLEMAAEENWFGTEVALRMAELMAE